MEALILVSHPCGHTVEASVYWTGRSAKARLAAEDAVRAMHAECATCWIAERRARAARIGLEDTMLPERAVAFVERLLRRWPAATVSASPKSESVYVRTAERVVRVATHSWPGRPASLVRARWNREVHVAHLVPNAIDIEKGLVAA